MPWLGLEKQNINVMDHYVCKPVEGKGFMNDDCPLYFWWMTIIVLEEFVEQNLKEKL